MIEAPRPMPIGCRNTTHGDLAIDKASIKGVCLWGGSWRIAVPITCIRLTFVVRAATREAEHSLATRWALHRGSPGSGHRADGRLTAPRSVSCRLPSRQPCDGRAAATGPEEWPPRSDRAQREGVRSSRWISLGNKGSRRPATVEGYGCRLDIIAHDGPLSTS